MGRTLAICKIAPQEVHQTLRARGLSRREGAMDRIGQTGLGVLRTDSRKVESGDIFLAYAGVHSDGHDHLAKAMAQGATLAVVEDGSRVPAGLPWIEVGSGRAAWACLAAKAFGDPQERMDILGVTGTNGKSSTAWMTGQLLEAAGVPCLTLGTLGAFLVGERIPTQHTTPDPDVLFALFRAALDQGVRVAVMEVSSHAITQEKVGPIRFAAAAFTSFTRDHLDFHPTMDDYFAAKWRLFNELSRPGATFAFADVIDRDLPLTSLTGATVVYGFSPAAKRQGWAAAEQLLIKEDFGGVKGSKITIDYKNRTVRGDVPYFAKHALENFAAAVILATKILGRPPEPSTWPRLAPVPGRLEQIVGPRGPTVVVDYAHTPDALEKTLTVLRPFTTRNLVVVFGCGGDRDRGKRPEMGKIAAALADKIYVTSDNPRTEDPERIARDVTDGIAIKTKLVVVLDRADAISRAVKDAEAGDLVVIAGKGHESYQIVKDRTVPFDDRDVARQCLALA